MQKTAEIPAAIMVRLARECETPAYSCKNACFLSLFVLKIPTFTGCRPKNGIRSVVITVTYIRAIRHDTADFMKQTLSYTVFVWDDQRVTTFFQHRAGSQTLNRSGRLWLGTVFHCSPSHRRPQMIGSIRMRCFASLLGVKNRDNTTRIGSIRVRCFDILLDWKNRDNTPGKPVTAACWVKI